MQILRQLALLFAGALASALISLLIFGFDICLIVGLSGVILLLILYGSGVTSKSWHRINLWRRSHSPKIGILSDMGGVLKNREIYTWTNISPEGWRKEIEKLAENEKVKIELINVGRNFDPYTAIVNPYGGVYPERNLKNFETLNKIIEYVTGGGLFVNVADIPSYFAYNQLLRRRLDATPLIYGIKSMPNGRIQIIPVRPFELTPLMEKLGLRVLNIEEKLKPYDWDIKFEDEFKEILNSRICKIKVHRAVVVEKNVKAVVKPFKYRDKEITPFFFAKYGEGDFLISLIFVNCHNENVQSKLRNIIAKLILHYTKRTEKQNDII